MSEDVNKYNQQAGVAAGQHCGSQASFYDDLRNLLNRWSQENKSNTPDFILVEYVGRCLGAFHDGVVARERWYGVQHAGLQTPDPMK